MPPIGNLVFSAKIPCHRVLMLCYWKLVDNCPLEGVIVLHKSGSSVKQICHVGTCRIYVAMLHLRVVSLLLSLDQRRNSSAPHRSNQVQTKPWACHAPHVAAEPPVATLIGTKWHKHVSKIVERAHQTTSSVHQRTTFTSKCSDIQPIAAQPVIVGWLWGVQLGLLIVRTSVAEAFRRQRRLVAQHSPHHARAHCL